MHLPASEIFSPSFVRRFVFDLKFRLSIITEYQATLYFANLLGWPKAEARGIRRHVHALLRKLEDEAILEPPLKILVPYVENQVLLEDSNDLGLRSDDYSDDYGANVRKIREHWGDALARAENRDVYQFRCEDKLFTQTDHSNPEGSPPLGKEEWQQTQERFDCAIGGLPSKSTYFQFRQGKSESLAYCMGKNEIGHHSLVWAQISATQLYIDHAMTAGEEALRWWSHNLEPNTGRKNISDYHAAVEETPGHWSAIVSIRTPTVASATDLMMRQASCPHFDRWRYYG